MTDGEKLVLDEFYVLCEQILKGEADQDDILRLTAAMHDINKSHLIAKEFMRIKSILLNKYKAKL